MVTKKRSKKLNAELEGLLAKAVKREKNSSMIRMVKSNNFFSNFDKSVLPTLSEQIHNNIYESVHTVNNIITTCLRYLGEKIHYNLKTKDIDSRIDRQIKIKRGLFYENSLKLLIPNFKKYSYELWNSTLKESKLILNLKRKKNRVVDLLFLDKLRKRLVYCELKSKNNHDAGKKRSMGDDFTKIKNYLYSKYGSEYEIECYIVFIEEDELKNLKTFGIDTKYFMTGAEFFNKYFGLDIADYFKAVQEIIDKEDLVGYSAKVTSIATTFFNYPSKYQEEVKNLSSEEIKTYIKFLKHFTADATN